MRRVLAATAAALVAMTMTIEGQERRVIPGPMPNLPFSAAVQADGLIYVAGALSQDGGDIRVQTRKVLEDMDKTLRAAGSRLANVASVNVYITRAEDFAAMNEVYRTFWTEHPPVRTTVVADLVIPGALIEFSMIAIPDGGERTVIHPPSWVPSTNPYSYGIKSGDTLFLAGLVSRNGRDNSVVEGDMTAQTKTVLDNAGEILKAAGMSYDHVVSSRVYITDGTKFQDMNGVYRQYFTKEPPARATVIAGLMGTQYQVEITLTAVNRPKRAIVTPQADGSPGRPSPILSSAIEVGNRLYLSGMLGNTADNKGDMEAQTRETLARIGRTLTAAGYDWHHIVDGIVYITDVAQFDAMNRAYRSIFAKDFPARATVRSGLVAADGLVEIMFVAVK
ncbi:MAG: RidA family protein [Vicinamibacterales bacterium]|nr:RidA family protein [Vicinamibacterales bacterium]